ncbi:MAG UNVERIFIED_CONTAM: hypothetical protein LVT10_22005 [Anaerolineae bacterium]
MQVPSTATRGKAPTLPLPHCVGEGESLYGVRASPIDPQRGEKPPPPTPPHCVGEGGNASRCACKSPLTATRGRDLGVGALRGRGGENMRAGGK